MGEVKVYHEVQQGQKCGSHALNTLLQYPRFSDSGAFCDVEAPPPCSKEWH
jgi:hypothetical protein